MRRPSTESRAHQKSAEKAGEANVRFELILTLDSVREEVRQSALSEDAKFLLKWILDALVLGGDPLLGLASPSAIRKGVVKFDQLSLAYAYWQERERGEKAEVAVRRVMEKSQKKRSTILSAVQAFDSHRHKRRIRPNNKKR